MPPGDFEFCAESSVRGLGAGSAQQGGEGVGEHQPMKARFSMVRVGGGGSRTPKRCATEGCFVSLPPPAPTESQNASGAFGSNAVFGSVGLSCGTWTAI